MKKQIIDSFLYIIGKKKYMPYMKKYVEEKKLKNQARKRIIVGLTGGVFDILHLGHIRTLKQMKKLCDVLLVVVATDESVVKNKGKKPFHKQEHRMEIVSNLKLVDAVIKGGKDPSRVLKKIKPDIILYGYDQKDLFKDSDVQKKWIRKPIYPEYYKSSRLRKKIGI